MSIKIKKAHASTDELQNDPEINVMRALEEYYVSGPQDRPRSFVRLLDWFHHEGPNGIHNCLVTELLGPSILGMMRVNKTAGGFFAPDTVLRASRQLLEGISFAYQAGFVHGGMSTLVSRPNDILRTSNARGLAMLSLLTYQMAKQILP